MTRKDALRRRVERGMLQSGTRVKCPNGVRRVETLVPGDLVTTTDHGALEVVACQSLSRQTADLSEELHPIRLDRWCFGPGFPKRDLTVSPAQRVTVKGARMEAMTGVEDGLVAASALIGQDGIRRLDRAEVSYTRIVLASPALLIVHGWALEAPGADATDLAEASEAAQFFSSITAEF